MILLVISGAFLFSVCILIVVVIQNLSSGDAATVIATTYIIGVIPLFIVVTYFFNWIIGAVATFLFYALVKFIDRWKKLNIFG